MTTSRSRMPHVPDGRYAVPDPAHPETTTLWWVADGELKTWPPKRRWAPFPPTPPRGLTYAERTVWRDDWYARNYWPWKAAVAEAILADPETARARFDQLVPEDQRPPALSPRQERAARRQQREQDRQVLAAAALAMAGCSTRQVAAALEVSPATGWRWVTQGLELYQRLENEALNHAARQFQIDASTPGCFTTEGHRAPSDFEGS